MVRCGARLQSIIGPDPGWCRAPRQIRLTSRPTGMTTRCGEPSFELFSSTRVGTTPPLEETWTRGSMMRYLVPFLVLSSEPTRSRLTSRFPISPKESIALQSCDQGSLQAERVTTSAYSRSEEHTSELQSRPH